jgi:hypothetical protein
MTTYYSREPSNAMLTMSWLARLGRGMRAERARERARINTWEYEGGSLFHPRQGAGGDQNLRSDRHVAALAIN